MYSIHSFTHTHTHTPVSPGLVHERVPELELGSGALILGVVSQSRGKELQVPATTHLRTVRLLLRLNYLGREVMCNSTLHGPCTVYYSVSKSFTLLLSSWQVQLMGVVALPLPPHPPVQLITGSEGHSPSEQTSFGRPSQGSAEGNK